MIDVYLAGEVEDTAPQNSGGAGGINSAGEAGWVIQVGVLVKGRGELLGPLDL